MILALATKTPIDYWMSRPIGELSEWIDLANEVKRDE